MRNPSGRDDTARRDAVTMRARSSLPVRVPIRSTRPPSSAIRSDETRHALHVPTMSKFRVTLFFVALALALGLFWTWRVSRSGALPAVGANAPHAEDARDATNAAHVEAETASSTALDAGERDVDERSSETRVAPAPAQVAATGKLMTLKCSGRVVDAQAAPIAGALVQVEQILSTRAGAQRELWRTSGLPNTTSAADGTFAFEFDTQPGGYALTASHTGASSVQHRRFIPGETNIVITLTPGGAIAGSLKLPEALPLRDVDVVLEHSEVQAAGADRERHRRVTVDADGKFGADDLMPGPWRIVVRQRGARELARREPISVRGGERTVVDVIDLAAVLHTIHIEVADESGALLPGAAVSSAGTRPGRDTWFATARAPGVFDVLVPNEGVSLAVACPGYATVEVRGANADQRVVLTAKIAVTLVARGTGALADSDGRVAIGVRFAPANATDESAPDVQTLSFDGVREITFDVARAGEYSASWIAFTAAERADGGVKTVPLTEYGAAKFDVRAGKQGARIELDVPSGILERARELASAGTPR